MIHVEEPKSENIFFDIIVESIYWDQPPELEVLVNNESVGHYKIDQPKLHIRFKRIMSFDGMHVLELRRSGKTIAQTKTLEDGSMQTQMLNIKNIKLDNIDLKNLILSRSTFEPEYLEPWATEQRAQGIVLEKVIPGEMHLGHNGVWKFEFTSPIYKLLVAWTKGTK